MIIPLRQIMIDVQEYEFYVFFRFKIHDFYVFFYLWNDVSKSRKSQQTFNH